MEHLAEYEAPATVQCIPIGAHLGSSRRWYTHHGIYVGAGEVVHYKGLSCGLTRGRIVKSSLSDFIGGGDLEILATTAISYHAQKVVERANSRLGEDRYDLLHNNCEHLCSWCLTGQARSLQIEKLGALPLPLRLVVMLVLLLAQAWTRGPGELPRNRCGA
jgi:hypothetical protein